MNDSSKLSHNISELKYIIIHNQVSLDKIVGLLAQLTTVRNKNGDIITKEQYFNFINRLPSNIHVYVIILIHYWYISPN